MSFLRTIVATALRFPDWLFGRRCAGMDLGPGLIAAGWTVLMIVNPDLFDQGSFVGMSWLADEYWIALFAIITGLHALGMVLIRAVWVRVSAALMSAWAWIFVAVSLHRVAFTPGVIAYGVIGSSCVLGAIYLAGLPRERR